MRAVRRLLLALVVVATALVAVPVRSAGATSQVAHHVEHQYRGHKKPHHPDVPVVDAPEVFVPCLTPQSKNPVQGSCRVDVPAPASPVIEPGSVGTPVYDVPVHGYPRVTVELGCEFGSVTFESGSDFDETVFFVGREVNLPAGGLLRVNLVRLEPGVFAAGPMSGSVSGPLSWPAGVRRTALGDLRVGCP